MSSRLREHGLEHPLFALERPGDASVVVGAGQVDIETALGDSAHAVDAVLELRARVEAVGVLEEDHRRAGIIGRADQRVAILAGLGLQQHDLAFRLVELALLLVDLSRRHAAAYPGNLAKMIAEHEPHEAMSIDDDHLT